MEQTWHKTGGKLALQMWWRWGNCESRSAGTQNRNKTTNVHVHIVKVHIVIGATTKSTLVSSLDSGIAAKSVHQSVRLGR